MKDLLAHDTDQYKYQIRENKKAGIIRLFYFEQE